MSQLAAASFMLAIYSAALLPVGLMARGAGGRVLPIAAISAVVALALVDTGIFQQASLAPTNAVAPVVGQIEEQTCHNVILAMGRAGLSFDRSNPAAPKLAGSAADKLPPEARDALLTCARTTPE